MRSTADTFFEGELRCNFTVCVETKFGKQVGLVGLETGSLETNLGSAYFLVSIHL